MTRTLSIDVECFEIVKQLFTFVCGLSFELCSLSISGSLLCGLCPLL